MLEKLSDKGNTPALLVGVLAGIALLDINMAIYQKIRKKTFLKTQQYSIVPQGHLLNYVHSPIVCHSQNLETT